MNNFWAKHFGKGTDTQQMDRGGTARRLQNAREAQARGAAALREQSPGRLPDDDEISSQKKIRDHEARTRAQQARGGLPQ